MFITYSRDLVHLTGSLKRMTILRDLNVYSVTVGDGNSIVAESIGDKRITMIQGGGNERKVVSCWCKHVPNIGSFSIFSLIDLIDKCHELENEERNITIKKGYFKLKFDHVIRTKSGYVCGVETNQELQMILIIQL